MTKEELLNKYGEAYEYLNKKAIYDLRSFARALGIAKPTMMQKEEVILSILKVASGEENAFGGSVRGTRPKVRSITSADIDELMQFFRETPVGNAELKLSANDLMILAELVYMGNYVINGYKKPGEVSENHFDVANEVFRDFYMLKNGVSDIRDIEDNKIADARDILYDKTEDYISQFEKDVFFEKLSDMLKEKIEDFLLEKK